MPIPEFTGVAQVAALDGAALPDNTGAEWDTELP